MSDMGPNAEVIIELTADAAKAAAEIEAAVAKALAEAMKSKAGRDAVNNIVNGFLKGFAKVGQAQQQTWKATTAAGQKSAQAVGSAFENMFKRVASKSNQAFRFNQARGSSHELQAMNALVADLAHNFSTLATDARSFNTVMTQMATSARAQLAAVEQERRTIQQAATSQNAIFNTQAQERANKLTNATKLQLAAIRSESAADRNASNERIANVRRFTAIATTSIRSLTQVFRTVFNGATVILRNAVNGMQAVIRGIANAFRSAFQAINGIVRSFASGFSRAFSGIGRGVTGALRGVSAAIRSALSRDEAATRASMNRRERMAQHSAGQQRNFLTTAFQASGLAGGAAGIFGILRSGFERFSDVETLQFRFERFLGSAQKAKDLISDLSDFARTTAFDLPGVANLATNFLAMGQSADQAIVNVQRLADVTAFAGGNTESLERIQRALGQIISTGKLQGDELNQLAENLPGINIRKIIADQMGVSTAELAKMQESGDISADAFITAFLTGIDDPRFQGAAVAIAGTLEGRMANLKESFGIFGAEIIGLAYGPISTAMTKITGFLSLAGDFVRGDGPMFDTKPVHAEDNPYVQMADDALIAFEDLPHEWQNQLGEMFGWTAGAGFVVSAADAKQWWDDMHPPDAEETVNVWKEIRDVMADFAKGVGAGAAIAGGFKAIALALRFLISPMTAAILLFGSLGVFWGKITDASPMLRSSLGIVGQQFGNLRTSLGETVGIVTDLISNAFFGKPNFWKNIGDRVANFTNRIGLLVNKFRIFVDWANKMLAIGEFGKIVDRVSVNVQGFIASLLGLTDAQQAVAQELGGNDFGNIFTAFLDKLENVPVLGPIVGFARRVVGAIVEALKGAWNFAGDIWHLVFGGEDQSDAMVASVLGGPGDTRSTGTKILDRLEETFLGPIVRFFRGPFMDGIHSVASVVDTIFDRFLIPGFRAVTNFFAEDFLPGIANVAGAIGRFLRPAIQTLGGLLGQVGTLLAPIGGAIEGFISTWKDKGIGSAISSLWDGVTEAAGNIWDGEDGTGGIKAGLQGAIDKITNWFSTTFTGKNVSGWITSALNGIRKVGYAIGKVIGSPEFLGTVIVSAAAVAAAVAAVIGAFGLGLAQGLAKEGVRWGKLIAGALQDGWNALAKGALDFLPDPVTNGISAMLGNPLIGTGIAAALAVLGGVIVKGLVGAVTNASTKGGKAPASFANLGLSIAGGLFTAVINGFKGVGKGALSVAQMILPKFPKSDGTSEEAVGKGIGSRITGGITRMVGTYDPTTKIGSGLKGIKGKVEERFGNVGTGIATAIVGGIAAYEFGNYAGKTGDAGSLIMALLGGAATGAAIGATFGGAGAALGAAIGVGVTLIGAHFGEATRKAQEFNDVVASIRDSLQGLNGDAANEALVQNISDRLTGNADTFADWGQQLTEGFDFGTFVQQVIDGTAEADQAFATMIGGWKEQLVGTGEVGPELVQKFTDSLTLAAQTGDFSSAQDLLNEVFSGDRFSGEEINALFEAMEKLPGGFTGIIDGSGDAGNAFKFFKGTIEGTAAAQATMAANTDIVTQAMENSIDPIDSVEEGLSAIRDALAAGDSGSQIAELLSNSDLTTAQSLEAIGTAADEVQRQLDDAVSAFQDALEAFRPEGDLAGDTAEGMVNSVIAHVPEMQDAYEQMLKPPEGETVNADVLVALKVERQGEFHDEVAGLIAAAAKEGIVFDDASMETWLEGFRTDLKNAGLDGDALEMANQVIDGFISGDFTQMIDPIVGSLTDQATLTEAGRIAASTFAAAFGGIAEAAVALGGPAALGSAIGAGAAAASPAPAVAVPITPVTQEDFAGAFDGVDAGAVATDLSQDFADKLPDQLYTAAGPMKNELNAVGTELHGTATSSGTLVGIKFVKSIGAGVTSAAQVPQSAVRNVVGGVKLAAASANQGMQNAGSNLARSLARGIQGSAILAVLAALAMAQAVVNTVKTALAISSPSKVFVTIGRQIGEGFMEGIEDSEGDMAAAISQAISDAVAAGVQEAGLEVARAQVAGTIWDMIEPSILPGGTTNAELQSAQLTLKVDLAGFVKDLREALAEALGATGNIDRADAAAAVSGIKLDLASAFNDATEQFNDAFEHSEAIADYAAALKKLKAELAQGATGALGQAARTRLRREAYVTLQEEAGQLKDRLKVLKDQYNAGKIKKKDYDAAVKEANEAYKTGPLQAYYEELAAIERHFKDGTLAAEEYADRLAKLGEAPEPLSFDERGIIASGPDSLNVNTAAGRANRETINDALSKIKEWGQAALAAGTPMADVIAKMKVYIKQITDAAKAAGLDAKAVQALIDAYGLSAAELAKLAKEATSLDISTVAGMENTKVMNEKLQDIRDYASMLLKAGVSTDEVTKQIKAMRQTFIDAAKAAGFNVADIQKLIDQMGLSDSALAALIEQLKAFDDATRGATAAAEAAANAANGGVARPIGDVHVHVPYGDPEAVARATANTLAYAGPTNW